MVRSCAGVFALVCVCACAAEPTPRPLDDVSGLDGQTQLAPRIRIDRIEGPPAEGELIASFDRSLWWDPSPDRIFAVFEAPSIQWITSAEIAGFTELPAAPAKAFQQQLREDGIVFERSPLDGASLVLQGNHGYHAEENGFGDFAWDLVRTDAVGRRHENVGTQNSDYLVWDAPVFAPTGGTVVEVIRDGVDNPPGVAGTVNNMVGIHLGNGIYLYLLHFRQDSIAASITVGTQISAGDFLGRVGNSGVTLEPHLHVTLLARQYDDDEKFLRSWSVPGEFRDLYVSQIPNLGGRHQAWSVPETGVWISSEAF